MRFTLALSIVLTASTAWGGPIVAIAAGRTSLAPKSDFGVINSRPGTGGKGKAVSSFDFHPAKVESTPFNKIIPEGRDIGSTHLGHVYPDHDETHTTGGVTDYFVGYLVVDRTPDEDGLGSENIFKSGAVLKATITPGPTEEKGASIDAWLKDPFAYSDTDPAATFNFFLEGMNATFSLGGETVFPDVFSLAEGQFGAIASGTSMQFRHRIAPGVQLDPDTFWSNDLEGAIDLWDLILTTDNDHNVTASLHFGLSNSFFVLDYAAASVSQLEQFIGQSFQGGRLTTDLNRLFTFGFVPRNGVLAYTTGDSIEVLVAGRGEVPEPATYLLASAGIVAMWIARRSRARIKMN